MANPVFVVVWPIRFTPTSRLTRGRPRQFSVMWQNIRCSILFHLLVPGGKVGFFFRGTNALTLGRCLRLALNELRVLGKLLLTWPCAYLRAKILDELGNSRRAVRGLDLCGSGFGFVG